MPAVCRPVGPGGIPLALPAVPIFFPNVSKCSELGSQWQDVQIDNLNAVGQGAQQAASLFPRAQQAASLFPQIGSFFGLVNNPSVWKHLGILIAGFVLLVVGIIVFAVDPDAKTAKTAMELAS